MDIKLTKLMDAYTPDLNPLIAGGVSVEQMKNVEDYIEQVLHVISEGFPDGLKYVGSRAVTPLEEFNYLTSKKQNKRTIDIARSDIYLRKYIFDLNGEKLERNIALPFVGKGGIMHMRGTKSSLAPVMSDKIISPANRTLFVKLMLTMFIVDKVTYHYNINDGQRVMSIVSHSAIYRHPSNSNRNQGSVTAVTSLLHYLLAKYGFDETFNRLTGTVPLVRKLSELDKSQYPESDWIICYSSGKKPKTLAAKFYNASDVCLIIPKDSHTETMQTALATFFYITDHFPKRVKVEDINKTTLWRILLGQIIWNDNTNEAKILMDVDDHMSYVDQYVCNIMKTRFKKIGLNITDTYELFVYIIQNLMRIIIDAAKDTGDMSDKELIVMPYVLQVIVEAINKFYYNVKRAAKKQLNLTNVSNTLNKNIAPTVILSASKSSACIDYSAVGNDNMAFKLTTHVIAQEKSNKARKKTTADDANNPAKAIHPSIAVICNYLGVTKADASGRGLLNPMVNVTSEYGFALDDETKKLMEETNYYLHNRVRKKKVPEH